MGWVLEYLLWKLPQHCGNQLVDGLSSNSSFFSLAYLGLHLFVFSCFFFFLEAHGGKLWVLMQESQVLG